MPAPANLVQEISTSAGLGDFTLTAADGRQTFDDAFGLGGTDVFDYFITSRDAGEWERGTGHLLNATTLVRDTVIESSNSDNPVSFSAGTTDVTNDVPAGNQVLLDGVQTFTGVMGFEQPLLEVNDVATPTDANADGAGFVVKATTDKTILWDNSFEHWEVSDSIRIDVIKILVNIDGPDGGLWDSGGIDLAQQKSYALNNTPILSENGGNFELNNIDVIDATTKATIENAIITLSNLTAAPVLTSVGALSVGSIVAGFGSINIGANALTATGPITGPSGLWDAGGMNIAAGDSYKIDGADVIDDVAGTITLENIAALDATTTATIEAAVVPDVVPQAEAEAGTATAERIWTAERVSQSIAALAPGGSPTFVGPITLSAGSPTLVTLASGIPAGTREIIIALDGASHNAANTGWIIQLGDAGGLETAGYSGGAWTDIDPDANANGFRFGDSDSFDASTTIVSEFTLQHVGGNQWTFSGTSFPSTGDYLSGVGLKTLSGELTQIALTTIAGAATIDGGTARIRYL